MRQIEVAIVVLQQEEDFLLQKRDKKPEIGGAGLIGCFGGKINNESASEAISREVAEETSLNLGPEEFNFLGDYDVISDHQLEEVKVKIQAFRFVVDQGLTVYAKEGKLVRMNREQAFANLDNMTSGTRACFEKYIGEV